MTRAPRLLLMILIFAGIVAGGCTKRKNRFIFSSETSTTPGDLAPKLESVFPERSSSNAAPGTEISAVFDRPVDPASVTTTSVVVRGPQGKVDGSVEVVAAGAGSEILFRPSTDLFVRGEYTVTLRQSIQTPQGNRLVGDQVWSFRTRDGLFDLEIGLDDGLFQETFAKVGMDDQGIGHSVWTSRGANGLAVQAALMDVETGWQPARPLDNGPDFEAASPHLAVNGAGDAIAIWTRRYSSPESMTGFEVMASHYDSENGWSDPERIDQDDENKSANGNGVTIDAAGNAIAVWAQLADQSDGRLWARRWNAESEEWEDSEPIQSTNTLGGVPVMQGNAKGHTYVVWRQDRATEVWANRYAPGEGWSGDEEISEAQDFVLEDPQIAVDSSGNAWVVMRQEESRGDDPDRLLANRWEDGWQGPVPIESQEQSIVEFDLASRGSGRVLVIWRQQGENDENDPLAGNEYLPGSGWQGDKILFQDELGHLAEPSVALDPDGNALVSFRRDVFGLELSDICVSRRPDGGEWDTPQAVEHTYESTREPLSVLDSQGNALVFWLRRDGRSELLQVARGIAGAGWLPEETVGTDVVGLQGVAKDRQGRAIAVWEAQDDIEAPLEVRGNAFR
ncbi:MAG: Ig-like domain-containing protein [Planctomycetota bacterium]